MRRVTSPELDDRVVGFARHAEPVEDAHHRRARPRRIGEQDRRATARAKARKRLACRRKGGNPVMHNAPNVAKQHVVIAHERREMVARAARFDPVIDARTASEAIQAAARPVPSASPRWR